MPRGGMGKRYPEDFKHSAVDMALHGDQSISQVARDLGIHQKTLYGWVSRYKKEYGIAEDEHRNEDKSLEAEVKRLRKENTKLKMERDILKKATAYFAKETM